MVVLPAPFGTEESDDLASRNSESEIVEGCESPKAASEPFELQDSDHVVRLNIVHQQLGLGEQFEDLQADRLARSSGANRGRRCFPAAFCWAMIDGVPRTGGSPAHLLSPQSAHAACPMLCFHPCARTSASFPSADALAG